MAPRFAPRTSNSPDLSGGNYWFGVANEAKKCLLFFVNERKRRSRCPVVGAKIIYFTDYPVSIDATGFFLFKIVELQLAILHRASSKCKLEKYE